MRGVQEKSPWTGGDGRVVRGRGRARGSNGQAHLNQHVVVAQQSETLFSLAARRKIGAPLPHERGSRGQRGESGAGASAEGLARTDPAGAANSRSARRPSRRHPPPPEKMSRAMRCDQGGRAVSDGVAGR